MDAPQNHIWGPHLWIILHSCTEKIGAVNLKRLPQEEQRIWINLLGSLRYSLPCPHCKKHYTEYFNKHPIRTFNKEFIRSWLYNLHSEVNIRTNKINTLVLEQLPEKYSQPINFTHYHVIISEQMLRALRLGWSSREDIQRTQRAFMELKRFYDMF